MAINTLTSLKTNKAQTSLQNLPEEILDNIVQYATTDVLSLRSTCRDIQAKTRHGFLREIISERTVWINRSSLQNLEDIANSDLLGPHVKKLYIMNYEWDLDEAEGIWGDGEGLDPDETRDFNHFYEHHGDQLFLSQSGTVTMTLARILPKLSKLEEIDLFPHEYCVPREHWRGDIALSSTLSDDFKLNGWFTLCQAMIASQWKPKALRIGYDEENFLTSECFTHLVAPQRALLAPLFSQLDKLELGFEVPEGEPDNNLWKRAFPDFLALCKNVSYLGLQFADVALVEYDDEENPPLSNLDEWPTFPNLKYMEMWHFRCHAEHLLTFLRNHKRTLKRLWLVEFMLALQDHWRMVLEGIADGLDLAWVDLSMLETRHGQIDLINEKSPHIQEAVENRVREGILCRKCTNLPDTDSDGSSDDDDGAEIDSELHSLIDEDEEADWEDEV